MFAFLGLWRFALYAAAIVAVIGGLAYAKSTYDDRRRAEGAAPYILAIENQKREATALLNAEIAKNEAFAKGLNDDYAKQIAVLRSRNIAGVRLTDPGRREGGNCSPVNPGVPQDPAPAPGLPRKPVELFLSETATTFLVNQAQRADEAALYAAKCREYVMKPTIREQVSKLRGVSQ